jgi:hypothetical protein
MPISLAEAAHAAGVNRSTILRAIKRGTISGARDASGAWAVEPAEVFRVFEPKAKPEAVQQSAQTDALVAELRAQLAEMRAQRNAWQGIAERLALGAPKPEAKPEPEPEPELPAGKLRRAWRWMRMTGFLAGAGILLALGTGTGL